MAKNILVVIAGILMSVIASTLLGQLALRVADFGSMVRAGKQDPASITQGSYGDPLAITLHMIRLTAFVLDPAVSLIVGLFVGQFARNSARWMAFLAILPLSAFAVYSHPRLLEGLVAGLIDIFLVIVAADVIYRWRRRRGLEPAN